MGDHFHQQGEMGDHRDVCCYHEVNHSEKDHNSFGIAHSHYGHLSKKDHAICLYNQSVYKAVCNSLGLNNSYFDLLCMCQ